MLKYAVIGAAGLALAACNTPQDRAVTGALVGGAAGAGIGAAATGEVGGAVAGGVLGAATGGIVGAATAPRDCYAYDAYGRPYRVAC